MLGLNHEGNIRGREYQYTVISSDQKPPVEWRGDRRNLTLYLNFIFSRSTFNDDVSVLLYGYFLHDCILLGPPGCAQNIPLLEPGSPRFFWWYENSE